MVYISSIVLQRNTLLEEKLRLSSCQWCFEDYYFRDIIIIVTIRIREVIFLRIFHVRCHFMQAFSSPHK
eukprot:c39412_g1_i1 orf=69-275(-)